MTLGWIVLAVLVVLLLVLDLGVFHKNAHVVGFKEACLWSVFWVAIALLFCGGIWVFDSKQSATLFLTGYIVEKALSVDNLFLFLVTFSYFSVDRKYQHRLLFWGILGAIVTRGIMIAAGVSLIHKFDWLMYVFGVFIIFTGIKTAFTKTEDVSLDDNTVLKLIKKYVPSKMDYQGQKFIIKENGKYYATPMLVVLLLVELTDILFAVDSIPAILGITTDPFLVFSSNIFAILGLRSLFFVLSGMMEMFEYLSYGVSAILVVVGIKMLAHGHFHLPEGVMLLVIALLLGLSILPSLPRIFRERRELKK